MNKITFTSKITENNISYTEIYFPNKNQIGTIIWLESPLLIDGKALPSMTLFKCNKILKKNKLKSFEDIQILTGIDSYPFSLGTVTAPTSQQQWHSNWEKACLDLGFDYHSVNAQNLQQSNIDLNQILTDRKLEFCISQWEMSYGNYFYGPDGFHLKIK